MKMPKMTAEQSTGAAINFYGGVTNPDGLHSDALEAANIFGDIWGGIKDVGGLVTGKLSCLAGCGINALPCMGCGKDLGCWAKCAGPSAIPCITKCLG